jgi:hypothetical protein
MDIRRVIRVILALACAPLWAQLPKEALQREVGGNGIAGSISGAPLKVATIAALKAVTVTRMTNGQQVEVANYATANDGGGGIFYFSSGSSATDNGGIFIAPTTGTGCWIRWFSSYVNAKWFGAKGNNLDNDSAPIQAAIDYVASLNGGVVFLPKGNYLCNVVLKTGVQLFGDPGSYGYLPSTISGVTMTQAVAGAVVDTPVGAQAGIAVVGINFMGLGSGAAGKGVYFRNVSWSAVRSCHFNNFYAEAFRQDAGLACVVEDVLAINCLLTAPAAISGVIYAGGTDHYLSRIEASASLAALTGTVRSFGICLPAGSANSFLSNCVGEISDGGYYIGGSVHRLSNCRADLNFGHGFYIAGQAQFANCTSLNNGQATTNTYDGFYIATSTAQGNRFSNCKAISNLARVHKYGFEDLCQYAAVGSRSTYDEGCTSDGHGTSEFYTDPSFGSGANRAPVQIQPTATGTVTIDVGGTSLAILAESGATTVTNFINGVNGQDLYARGNSNVTIKNNTTIKTSTGADKTLANDKCYHFKLIAGVWIEVTN